MTPPSSETTLPRGCPIEVWISEKACWYDGVIRNVDTKKSQVRVIVEGLEKPIDASDKDIRPRQTFNLDHFEFENGMEVDVKDPSGNNSGWKQGKITQVKGDFYYVDILDGHGVKQQSHILEKHNLRPYTRSSSVGGISMLQKLCIKPGSQLAPWLLSEEGRSCVDDVVGKANIRTSGQGIAMWHFEIDDLDHTDPAILIFGDDQCRKRVQMQMEIHFRLQKQLHDQRSTIDARLTRLQRYESSESYVFKVSENHCGLIVGQKGSNIQRVQKMYPGVEINIAKEGSIRDVTIYAPTKQILEQAKEEFEIRSVKWRATSDQMWWLRRFTHVSQIARESNLCAVKPLDRNGKPATGDGRLRDEDTTGLELTGFPASLANALNVGAKKMSSNAKFRPEMAVQGSFSCFFRHN